MTRAKISGLSGLVLLAGLIRGIVSTRAQAAGELVTVTLTPGSPSVAQGLTVTVGLAVTSNGDPGGFQGPILYDSTKLTFVSCAAASGSQCIFNSAGQSTVASSALPADGQTATLATATFTASAAGSATVTVSGECNASDSAPPFGETGCAANNTSITVTGGEGPTATNTPTNTVPAATATNTRTNTPTRTATATRTATTIATATSTAVIGGGGLTPTATVPTGATAPAPTNTTFPTNTATATNTARPTDTALPTNTQAGRTNTPAPSNTVASTSTAVASGTAAVSATSGSGNTATPTRTGGAPLPPATGTGGDFAGTSAVAALFLVAIGLGVSGFAATRVTRKR